MPDDDIAALRASAHPLRLRILSLLTAAPMSAAEVARELDITHANASYHLRVLVEAGELVEAGQERIRGGVAKRYRHPWREVMQGERPVRSGDLNARAMAAELVRRFEEREQPGRTFLCDAELWVDPETWDRVTALLTEAATLLHDHARAPHSEGTRHVNLTAAAFGMTER